LLAGLFGVFQLLFVFQNTRVPEQEEEESEIERGKEGMKEGGREGGR